MLLDVNSKLKFIISNLEVMPLSLRVNELILVFPKWTSRYSILMVCSHFPTRRPIKMVCMKLCGVQTVQTETNTDSHLVMFFFIFTTRKRSLGQGNNFTAVCPHGRGEGGGLPDRGPSWTETSPLDRDPPVQ